mmetsp:Transcript_22983/g.61222  ORF Transcript_22983/g.61222 Transcript_22983/m.61222 type:complete len:293 (-) Transcript_22983:101-979(-)
MKESPSAKALTCMRGPWVRPPSSRHFNTTGIPSASMKVGTGIWSLLPALPGACCRVCNSTRQVLCSDSAALAHSTKSCVINAKESACFRSSTPSPRARRAAPSAKRLGARRPWAGKLRHMFTPTALNSSAESGAWQKFDHISVNRSAVCRGSGKARPQADVTSKINLRIKLGILPTSEASSPKSFAKAMLAQRASVDSKRSPPGIDLSPVKAPCRSAMPTPQLAAHSAIRSSAKIGCCAKLLLPATAAPACAALAPDSPSPDAGYNCNNHSTSPSPDSSAGGRCSWPGSLPK